MPKFLLPLKEPQEATTVDLQSIVSGVYVNELVGQESQEKISPGHVVKAMILNGLGFVNAKRRNKK